MTAAKRKEDQKVKEQVKKEDQKIKRARVDIKKDTVSRPTSSIRQLIDTNVPLPALAAPIVWYSIPIRLRLQSALIYCWSTAVLDLRRVLRCPVVPILKLLRSLYEIDVDIETRKVHVL